MFHTTLFFETQCIAVVESYNITGNRCPMIGSKVILRLPWNLEVQLFWLIVLNMFF